MTRLLRFVFALAGAGAVLLPNGLGAQEVEGRDALAVVHTLFDAMRAGDAEVLGAVFHSDARLMTALAGRNGDPTVRTVPIQNFIESVAQSTAKLDERLWDEEVRVNGNLATVWTPYALYVDGAFSHCGVDAFQLGKTPDGWKILQITDTRQVEGCVVPDHVKPTG